MADTAAWLVDRVLPRVKVRQWVLSLPYRVRLLCAYDPATCTLVRQVFVRAVLGLLRRRARTQGVAKGRSGAVVFAQRFDSALRLNLHFHGLFLDGVYEGATGGSRFVAARQLRDADVDALKRILGHLGLRTEPPRLEPARGPPELPFAEGRSEERRVGKECTSWCRSRWSPYH